MSILKVKRSQPTTLSIRRKKQAARNINYSRTYLHDASIKLSSRWEELRYHKGQSIAMSSTSRFNVCHSGRRSGKTELLGKRKLVIKALIGSSYYDGGRYFAAAPTRDQAKRIFWKDLKLLVPKEALAGRPSETDLMIPLVTGAELWVLGLDKPERLEGTPWDHGVVDEIGNTKQGTWEMHIRPALSDRKGSCDFIGVPEGRGEYYELNQKALRHMKKARKLNQIPRWCSHHWHSSEILDKDEIEDAKEDMDEMTYDQEYRGLFLYFSGRAYYNYTDKDNEEPCRNYYDPNADLVFCFDFNVEPGVAAVVQELQEYEDNIPIIGKTITAVMDEVYIKRSSNTEKVCQKLIEKYGNHQGRIFCYGDATGGARGTAKVRGSDWTIVARELRNHFGYNRIFLKVPKRNPSERSRVNAVNSRIRNTNSEVYLVVDSENAPMTTKDFEGTRLKDDGSGEIDKKKDKWLTHLTDAIGYYLWFEFPVDGRRTAKLIRV